jgi:hypothetical protein
MSKNRSKKPLPVSGKKQAPSQRRQPTEVQKVSPLALVGGIGAALIIAAILLFVINARLSSSATPAPTAATPISGVVPTIATSPGGQTSGVTLLGGFSKGNAQAKVTLTEFADFK